MVHLRGLCDVLEISLDEAVKGAPDEAKTAMEAALLQSLRRMSDADAEVIMAMAKRLESSK